jgi:hypothetical protein
MPSRHEFESAYAGDESVPLLGQKERYNSRAYCDIRHYRISPQALRCAPPAASQVGNCSLIQGRLVGELLHNKIHKHLRPLRQ